MMSTLFASPVEKPKRRFSSWLGELGKPVLTWNFGVNVARFMERTSAVGVVASITNHINQLDVSRSGPRIHSQSAPAPSQPL